MCDTLQRVHFTITDVHRQVWLPIYHYPQVHLASLPWPVSVIPRFWKPLLCPACVFPMVCVLILSCMTHYHLHIWFHSCFSEPGYYEAGNFGIRIESVMAVKKVFMPMAFENVEFFGFETLALVLRAHQPFYNTYRSIILCVFYHIRPRFSFVWLIQPLWLQCSVIGLMRSMLVAVMSFHQLSSVFSFVLVFVKLWRNCFEIVSVI